MRGLNENTLGARKKLMVEIVNRSCRVKFDSSCGIVKAESVGYWINTLKLVVE
jgi:hypothetical protein